MPTDDTAITRFRSKLLKAFLGLLVMWSVAWFFAATYHPPALLSDEVVAIPGMLGNPAFWESRGGLALIFLGTATLVFAAVLLLSRGRLRIALSAALVSLVAARLAVGIAATDERESQSCANCRSFIPNLLREYAQAHDGWLPRGGRDELDSLTLAIADVSMVHMFTSHAQARAAVDQWERTRGLSWDSCCYRYNEGLRLDDPAGLLILYTSAPSTWECSHHPGKKLGRACLLHPGMDLNSSLWEFLPEERFQAAQSRTRAYLETRNEQAAEILAMREALALLVTHEKVSSGRHRFGVRMENRGDQPLRVCFLERGRFDAGEVGGQDHFCDPDEVVSLPPGAHHSFAWWYELEIEFSALGDSVLNYNRNTRSKNSSGSGAGSFHGISRAEVEAKNQAEAWGYVATTAEGKAELKLTLRSRRIPFFE